MCEMPDCYIRDDRKARKPHTCCECKGRIRPGETYHYHHGVWAGDPLAYKVCLDCDALREQCDLGLSFDDCTPFGYLSETVGNSAPQHPEALLRFIEIKTRRGAAVPQWMQDLADPPAPCVRQWPVVAEGGKR
jgi:hypothetical protein